MTSALYCNLKSCTIMCFVRCYSLLITRWILSLYIYSAYGHSIYKFVYKTSILSQIHIYIELVYLYLPYTTIGKLVDPFYVRHLLKTICYIYTKSRAQLVYTHTHIACKDLLLRFEFLSVYLHCPCGKMKRATYILQ